MNLPNDVAIVVVDDARQDVVRIIGVDRIIGVVIIDIIDITVIVIIVWVVALLIHLLSITIFEHAGRLCIYMFPQIKWFNCTLLILNRVYLTHLKIRITHM